ncbi:hypothetical protein SAMN05444172_4635 [Burkholderia sp. GAS332]|nr:hypothetical protein SAMN05444172_4635 [Burkholderia sp. GAS332]
MHDWDSVKYASILASESISLTLKASGFFGFAVSGRLDRSMNGRDSKVAPYILIGIPSLLGLTATSGKERQSALC